MRTIVKVSTCRDNWGVKWFDHVLSDPHFLSKIEVQLSYVSSEQFLFLRYSMMMIRHDWVISVNLGEQLFKCWSVLISFSVSFALNLYFVHNTRSASQSGMYSPFVINEFFLDFDLWLPTASSTRGYNSWTDCWSLSNTCHTIRLSQQLLSVQPRVSAWPQWSEVRAAMICVHQTNIVACFAAAARGHWHRLPAISVIISSPTFDPNHWTTPGCLCVSHEQSCHGEDTLLWNGDVHTAIISAARVEQGEPDLTQLFFHRRWILPVLMLNSVVKDNCAAGHFIGIQWWSHVHIWNLTTNTWIYPAVLP